MKNQNKNNLVKIIHYTCTGFFKRYDDKDSETYIIDAEVKYDVKANQEVLEFWFSTKKYGIKQLVFGIPFDSKKQILLDVITEYIKVIDVAEQLNLYYELDEEDEEAFSKAEAIESLVIGLHDDFNDVVKDYAQRAKESYYVELHNSIDETDRENIKDKYDSYYEVLDNIKEETIYKLDERLCNLIADEAIIIPEDEKSEVWNTYNDITCKVISEFIDKCDKIYSEL